MKQRSPYLLAGLLALTLFALVGCNTFRGMGRDIEALGDSMQEVD